MMFRKRPVVVEAMKFTEEDKDRCYNFVRCSCSADRDATGAPVLQIQTLEGVMTANLGDWIIKGVAGEYYPCRNDIFEQTYEEVPDGA